VLISYLCELLHHAQRAAGARQQQLLQEVQERQRFENDALRSQALLQAITDNASTAIFVKDLDGRYLLGNRNMCELFNVSKEQLIGLNDYDILPPDIAGELRANGAVGGPRDAETTLRSRCRGRPHTRRGAGGTRCCGSRTCDGGGG
jgi:PAS domain-containing protein